MVAHAAQSMVWQCPSMMLLLLFLSCLHNCYASAVGHTAPATHAMRLPTQIKPYHYDLSMEPFLDNSTYRGHVEIYFHVIESTKAVTLHAQDLEITKATIQRKSKSDTPSIKSNKQAQTLTFHLDAPLQAETNASIHLYFNGNLRSDLSGFFSSAYTQRDGSAGTIAVTHMEPTFARRAFPCFDEPALKATFTVTLIADANLTCISNMNVDVVKHVQSLGVERKAVRFHKSPPMSTYTVAFTVGELSYIEIDESRIPIRIYTSPADDAELGHYLAQTLARGLAFYEDAFGIDYQLPKLDVLAAPTFVSGAMENWGLIVAAADLVTYDPSINDVNKQHTIAELQLHELAHQWFGNLVTLQWWDQTWLNEGGASAVTAYCLKILEPNWTITNVNPSSEAFVLDAYRSSHAIEATLSTPDDIIQGFDQIAYAKGSIVLDMIREYLTPDTFLIGIARYLKVHSFGCTRTEDLWSALSEVSGQGVAAMMGPWTKRPGYPFIKITEGADAIYVEQHRFLLTGNVLPEEDETLWQLVLNIKTSEDLKSSVLYQRSGSVSLDLKADDFYMINADHTNLFRIQYPIDRLHKLSRAAQKGVLRDDERASLISDACALAQSGHYRASTCLDLIQSLNEEGQVPWEEIAGAVDAIRYAWIDNDKISEGLTLFYRNLAGRISCKLGWDLLSGDDSNLEPFKANMFLVAGMAGDKEVLRVSRSMFRRFAADGDERVIPPGLLRAVLSTSLYHGGQKEYETILEFSKLAQSQFGRFIGRAVLLVTEDNQLIQRTLDAILAGEYTPREASAILSGGIKYSKTAQRLAWKWAQENWTQLKAFYPDAMGIRETLAAALSRYMSSQEQLDELEAFVRERDIRGMESQLNLGLEIVRGRVAWVERDTEDLDRWLGLDEAGEL